VKKIFGAIVATTLLFTAAAGGSLISPTTAEAAGVTYKDLKVGYSIIISGSSFVVTSGSDVVSVSQYGWVTGLKVGSATIKAYDSSGVLTWTYYINVTR